MSELGFILQKPAGRNRAAQKNKPVVAKRQMRTSNSAAIIPGGQILTARHDSSNSVSPGRKLEKIGRWKSEEFYVYGNEARDSLEFQKINDQLIIRTKGKSDDTSFLRDEIGCTEGACAFRRAVFVDCFHDLKAKERLADILNGHF